MSTTDICHCHGCEVLRVQREILNCLKSIAAWLSGSPYRSRLKRKPLRSSPPLPKPRNCWASVEARRMNSFTERKSDRCGSAIRSGFHRRVFTSCCSAAHPADTPRDAEHDCDQFQILAAKCGVMPSSRWQGVSEISSARSTFAMRWQTRLLT